MRTTTTNFDTIKEQSHYRPYLKLYLVSVNTAYTVWGTETYWPRLGELSNLTVSIDLAKNVATINDFTFDIMNHDDAGPDLETLGLHVGGSFEATISFMDGDTRLTADEMILFEGTIKGVTRVNPRYYGLEVVDAVARAFPAEVGSKSGQRDGDGFYPMIFGSFRVDHHPDGDDLLARTHSATTDVYLPQQDGSMWKHQADNRLAPLGGRIDNAGTTATPPRGMVSYLVHNGRVLRNFPPYDCGLGGLYSVWAWDGDLKQYVKIAPFFDLLDISNLATALGTTDTEVEIAYAPYNTSLKLTGQDGYVLIDNEVIQYTTLSNDAGIIRLTGCTRGALGTFPASHTTQAVPVIYQYHVHLADVLDVSGAGD